MATPESVTAGFLEGVAGPRLSQGAWARRLARIRPDYRVAGVAALLCALLFVPYLGAVGLWDPWETHYGEVAREMIQRNDYVYPYWETAWFFSKPPLTMWMQALGMQLVGTQRGDEMIPLYTEWGMRLPFALFSILAVALLAMAVARLAGSRVGLATALVLSTTPLYFLLTRQTVTDTPFVTSLICAMACALIAQLDGQTRHRDAWWYGFYVFCGLGVLAKGLLGVLPGVVLLLYALCSVIPYDSESLAAHWDWLRDAQVRQAVRRGERPMPFLWGQLYRMHFLTGVLAFLVVAAPWYVTLFCFDGVDDEGKTWFQRFIIHDHFNRLAAGVHTTTPGGNFSYFIEQAGYALFPWVALVPGALLVVALARPRDARPAEQLGTLAALWAAVSFFVVAISATKFHHYLFPTIPALAVLMALYIDRLWREGVAAHAGSLLAGFVLLVLVAKDLSEPPAPNDHGALYGGFKVFTDLFVYNYDRPYPAELLNKPVQWLSQRPLYSGEVLAVLLLAVGGYLLMESLWGERRSSSGRVMGAALLATGGAVLWAVAARWSDAVGSALFQPVTLRLALAALFFVFIGLTTLGALMRSRQLLFGSFAAGVLVFAVWFNWGHWVSLSHHWTQRDLFWRYYQRRRPGEPIAAYLMNWKGETFYSRNRVRQLPIADTTRKTQLFTAPPGREWILVEHARLNALRAAVGADKVVTPVDRDLNNKFVLVTVE